MFRAAVCSERVSHVTSVGVGESRREKSPSLANDACDVCIMRQAFIVSVIECDSAGRVYAYNMASIFSARCYECKANGCHRRR